MNTFEVTPDNLLKRDADEVHRMVSRFFEDRRIGALRILLQRAGLLYTTSDDFRQTFSSPGEQADLALAFADLLELYDELANFA